MDIIGIKPAPVDHEFKEIRCNLVLVQYQAYRFLWRLINECESFKLYLFHKNYLPNISMVVISNFNRGKNLIKHKRIMKKDL